MAEYIDKTKFEELMCKKVKSNFDLYYVDKSEHYHTKAIGYSIAADEAHVFPTADVQPIRHGRWINDGDCMLCSCCNYAYNSWFMGSNYCPNCGADMRKEK